MKFPMFWPLACACLMPLISASADPGDLSDATLDMIIDTYVGNTYRRGQEVGVSVGITLNGKTYFKNYGYKSHGDTSAANEVNEHSNYEIGSVTKIWTTLLLGQAIATSTLSTTDLTLYTILGDFPSALPALQDATKKVTIGELASFTGGFPDVGDTNGQGHRPSIASWGVGDFVTAISALVPRNNNLNPPPTVSLPAPYFYSDWSTGLLGLLISNDTNTTLPANAVDNWYSLVEDNIVTPLGMADTYLFTPDVTQAANTVLGYEQATAEAIVKNGRINAITVTDEGGSYSGPPLITIEQPGGGSGATAVAVMDGSGTKQFVKKIVVTNPGSGYREGPSLDFQGGAGRGAMAQPIVLGGKIVGAQMLTAGTYGYEPRIKIKSAKGEGAGAEATAHLSNGGVLKVKMTNEGSGYSSPPVIKIAPGPSGVNVVPVWAAAGALKSSTSDLISLCQVYLGQQQIGVATVSPDLIQGASMATAPLIQTAKSNNQNFTAMAWSTTTGDIEGGDNVRVGKDGGLPGFSSYVQLVPAIKLGVVILANNHQGNKAVYEDGIGNVSTAICLAIEDALKPSP